MVDTCKGLVRTGLAVALTVVMLGGCGEDSGKGNAQPITGTPTPVAPAPAPAQPRGTSQIAGEVFAASGPVVGAGVTLWVQSPQYGWYWDSTGLLVTDTTGHFSANGLEDDATLTVKVIDDAYKQPCVANADVRSKEPIRVEVVPVGDFDAAEPPRPSTAKDPSLTGTVYETTPEGRRPVSGAHVDAQIRINYIDELLIATALTGRDGRYYLCNLPNQVGVIADKAGFVTTTVGPIDTTSNVPLDLDLRRADDF